MSPASPSLPGVFIAFEGGEGSGKSTQVRRLADRLAEVGREVVVTFEPGGTDPGAEIRRILLGRHTAHLAPRAEALLFAADRAHHAATVIRPGLQRGAVVLCDRYLDSSIAYQGAGRDLDPGEIRLLSLWATEGLLPTLTVLLDIDPAVGLRRAGANADRLESEPLSFHRAVRGHFLQLAGTEPERYLVCDATAAVTEVADLIWDRVGALPAVTR
jgi:dTMP kinase